MPKVSTNGGIDCVKKDQKSISPILSNPGLNADSWAIRANSLYYIKRTNRDKKNRAIQIVDPRFCGIFKEYKYSSHME